MPRFYQRIARPRSASAGDTPKNSIDLNSYFAFYIHFLTFVESMRYRVVLYGLGIVFFMGLLSCKKNIFKPKVIKNDNSLLSALGNRKSVDGVFLWFKNAYEFRDSTLYGKLLHPNFRFTYYDFANNTQISWDRGEEMRIQHRLFQNVKNISLTWNNYLQVDTTATNGEVIRSFNLLLEIDAYTSYRGTGRVIFTLTRNQPEEEWMLLRWFDDSDF